MKWKEGGNERMKQQNIQPVCRSFRESFLPQPRRAEKTTWNPFTGLSSRQIERGGGGG